MLIGGWLGACQRPATPLGASRGPGKRGSSSDRLPLAPPEPAGRNDIAANMAAAEQEARPAEAAVSSIVSTPLGRMAKITSPTKKPPLGVQARTPSGAARAGAGGRTAPAAPRA